MFQEYSTLYIYICRCKPSERKGGTYDGCAEFGIGVILFLTEAGEYSDPFILQYVAGHDNIKITVSYVHPREAAVHKLFARLADLERPEERTECKKSVQNPVQLEMSS